MRHIIPISGKDSLTTALVVMNDTHTLQKLDLEYIYNDTGAELPETYEWLSKVENQLGIKINRIGKDLWMTLSENKSFTDKGIYLKILS